MDDGQPSEPRSARVRGMLAEIALQRELRDEAYDAAEHPAAAWLESGELGRRARGAQDGLEALVMTALGDEDPPSDDELAETGGLTLDEVGELRARLEGGPGPAPEPRGRFRLRGRGR
ncbi:hypothetical protein AB0L40_02935 [Patulibacter sp. NPDC049589]|uniref:hypothetical protein n=1 Tax=Patulibacter sp. NPDC049589 TaxID=3154731 RepID=UPI00344A2A8C